MALTIDGEDFEGDGTGNGGFDAFMDAVTKILSRIGFVMPLLKDYEVHILGAEKPTRLPNVSLLGSRRNRNLKHEELTQIRSWLL